MKITIVGAGLGGSLLGIYLARRGYEVHLFELRGDLRREPVEVGRSIKLTLAERGLAALRELGLEERVKSTITVPLRGRAVHSGKGTVVYQPYGKNDQEVIYSFSRNDLNGILLDVAEEHPNLRVHFNQRCIDLDKETATAMFRDTKAGTETRVAADLVVGADGAYSVVRQLMQRRERADYRQDYLPWGYKEVSILGAVPGLPPMDRNFLHIWPCGDYLLFALPNFDGSLCGVCVLPFEGPYSFGALKTDREILELFGTHFADALPYMPNAVEEFRTRPISEFVTVRTSRWSYKDKILLIGDAAHSVVPFYGQGMNAAFEDAAILNRLLDRYGNSDWGEMLREFTSLRKPNTDILAQLSIENFDELRDTARRPIVTARKRTSIFLNRLFRQHCVPLYTMVSHSTLPYSECVERHRRHERIARWLGLDLVLAAVSLHLKIKTALSNRRAARLARSRAAAPSRVVTQTVERGWE
ncbi:MAG TPA: NAD(P)/FAD-dependent oxidoreductase [Thermoanaerobaculia bacterium]